MKRIRCRNCGREKDEVEFNWRFKEKNERQPICKECSKITRKKHYEAHREEEKARTYQVTKKRRGEAMRFIYEYLSGSVCADCRTFDFEVLTFDHVRGKKRMDVMTMAQQGYSIEAILEEISKCDVVCFNCHMMREVRRKSGKGRFGRFWPKFPWEDD